MYPKGGSQKRPLVGLGSPPHLESITAGKVEHPLQRYHGLGSEDRIHFYFIVPRQ